MQNYAFARGSMVPRGPRREGPADQGFVSNRSAVLIWASLMKTVPQLPPLPVHVDKTYASPAAPTNGIAPNSYPQQRAQPQPVDPGRPTFGIDLAEQMNRDNVEVPPIMEKCCEAIEKYGIGMQGIYRVNGTVTKAAKLREKLDRGMSQSMHPSYMF